MSIDLERAAESVYEHMCRCGGGPSPWYRDHSEDDKRYLRQMAKAALGATDLDAAARAIYEADERCRVSDADRGCDTWESIPAFLRYDYRQMALAARQCGAAS